MLNVRCQIVVLLGAVVALGFAFFQQYVNGLHPCEMCIWQRCAYAAVILCCLLRNKWLISLALAVEVALAVYHTGVEQHWWAGVTACSSSFAAGSLDALKAQITAAPAVRCDDIAWKFLGLSMAAWNAVYAGILLLISSSAIFCPPSAPIAQSARGRANS